MKILCFLKGHDINSDWNDSGYEIYKRCGLHEYYDSDSWQMRYCLPYILRTIYYELRSWLRYRIKPIFYTRCQAKECRKFKTILWVKIKGNHDNCDDLPF